MNLEVASSEAITYGAALSDAPALRRHTGSVLRQIVCGIIIAGFGLASYFLVSHFFLQSVQVVGISMLPTLQDSQHYLLNRWIYYVREPQVQDIVVLRDPVDDGYSVKRVIAGAGESVYLKDGQVFVNGRKLEEPYLSEHTPTYPYGHGKDQLIVCGTGSYFVLGDNRMNSADSRTYGLVPRRKILGLIVR